MSAPSGAAPGARHGPQAARPQVAVATKNPGKVREIRAILAGAPVEIVDPDPLWVAPPEDAPDYRGNALAKARSLAALMGIPALADDSGIEVDALGGAPGPRSARYAGENASDRQNLHALIEAVRAAPEPRSARYRCVAALVDPASGEAVAEGTVEGRLILEPRGSGGFGYDPIFVPEERDGCTMAELDPADKDSISHRGRAFRALIPPLGTIARR